MKPHFNLSQAGLPSRSPKPAALLALTCLLLSLPAQAISHRWYSPAGGGNGSSSSTPKTFSAADVNSFLNNSSESEFVIHLLPSTSDYEVTEKMVIHKDYTNLAALKISIVGEGDRPEEARLINKIPLGTGGYNNPDYIFELSLSRPATTSGQAPTTALQLVVENLLLDGNWDWKMANIGHPALGQGYKNAPLNLLARTGAVRKVIIRNFGAVGYAPWSHVGGVAGVETFPCVVGGHDVGQAPPSGWRRPWVVEDCEFHGFTGPFSGYTTQLMAHSKTDTALSNNYTPSWIREDSDRRFVLVRNVQFRSEGDGAFLIAMGSSGHPWGAEESGRASFIDNIVLNNSIGYSADTGKVRHLDFLNNLALNVWWWVNLNATAEDWHSNLDISENSIRFGPQVEYPTFRTFCWGSDKKPYTDLSLQIGRWETNTIFTAAQLGTFEDVRMDYNWITTLPTGRFDETNPGSTNGQYRLVYKVPNRSGPTCDLYPVDYYTSDGLVIGSNYESDYAHDFYPSSSPFTTNATYNSVTSSSPSGVQALRPALSTMYLDPPAAFGRIARVLPTVVTNARNYSWKTGASTTVTQSFIDDALRGAWELSLGDPVVTNTSLSLLTRFVCQPTPSAAQPTVHGDNKLIWLTATGLVSDHQWATTDSVGEATFTVPFTSGSHGEIAVTAFHDPRTTNGASGEFSTYEVAFAKAVIPIGTVISVKARKAVAIDRSELGVQEGLFQFTRTGSTSSSLTINFTLKTDSLTRPATLGTDYSLAAVSPTTWSNGGSTHTLTFAAGSRVAELRLIPVADELLERETAWIVLQSGTGYAPSGVHGDAAIFIYDGPEWTLHEITHTTDPNTGITTGVGLSNDLGVDVVAAANFETRRYVETSPGNWSWVTGDVGGGWLSLYDDPFWVFDSTISPALSPRATGVSDGDVDAVYSGFKIESSSHPRALTAYQDTWDYLDVPTSGWLSEKNKALGISPNGNYVAGYATRTQSSPSVEEQQPVFWNAGTFDYLFGSTGLSASHSGEARAVNDSGEFVGHRVLRNAADSEYIPRAFRSRINGTEVENTDFLIPPLQPGSVDDADVASKALFITPRSGNNSGFSGGWAVLDPAGSHPRNKPVIWWRRIGSNSEIPGEWVPIDPAEGVINASSDGNELLGSVSDSGGANPRAWRWPNGWTSGHGFDDKFLAHGFSSSWVLEEIVAANASRAFLGNGRKSGVRRSFLLVRQFQVN